MYILSVLVFLLPSLIQYLSTLSKMLSYIMEYLFFKCYSHREKYVQIILVALFLTCYSLLVHKVIQGQLKEVCFDLGIKGDEISKACYLASGSIP